MPSAHFTKFYSAAMSRLTNFPVRERDNVVYWKTKRKINNDLQQVVLFVVNFSFEKSKDRKTGNREIAAE